MKNIILTFIFVISFTNIVSAKTEEVKSLKFKPEESISMKLDCYAIGVGVYNSMIKEGFTQAQAIVVSAGAMSSCAAISAFDPK